MKPSLLKEILVAAAQLQASIGQFLTGLSFWPDVVRISTRISTPLVAFANWTLATMPVLRRAEWLLEIESLTKRHPVTLAVSLAFVFLRGLSPSHLGHIGTDALMYPFLAAISGFNPYLGIVCGAVFGVGDLIQKLLWNDIYGTQNANNIGVLAWTDVSYWGAIIGYAIAYSSTMSMGLLPGMASRTCRLAARYVIARFFHQKAAAAADGARPPQWGDPPLPDPAGNRQVWGQPLSVVQPVTNQGTISPGHLTGARQYETPADGGYMAGHLAGARQYETPRDGGFMAGHLAGARAQAAAKPAGPVVAMFSSVRPTEQEHPAAKAAREFHQKLQHSQTLQDEIRALQADPRNLLADPNAWRSEALTPKQKTLLAQLRGQRLLGPEGNARLEGLMGGSAAMAAAASAAAAPPEQWAQPGGPTYPPAAGGGVTGTNGGGTMTMLEALAGMGGGAFAAAIQIGVNAPIMEYLAFMLRDRPDTTCLQAEVDRYLRGRIPTLFGAGGLAGAVDVLSKGGTNGPGPTAPAPPTQASLIDRLNTANAGFNPSGVDRATADGFQDRINRIREKYGRTQQLDEQDVLDLERFAGIAAADTKQKLDDQFVRESDEHAAWRATQDALQRQDAANQAKLRQEYERILDKYSQGGLETAQSIDTLNNWRDRVVDANGRINPDALKDMTRVIANNSKLAAQQEFDLARAVAEAKDRQMKAAQAVRDAAWTAAGSFAGGALVATNASIWAAAGVNAAIGGLTGAATAASDHWDKSGKDFLKEVAWSTAFGAGLGGGMTAGFGGLGKVAPGWVQTLGHYPVASGTVLGGALGGLMAGAQHGNILDGVLHGAALGAVGGAAGSLGHWHGTAMAEGGYNIGAGKGGAPVDVPDATPAAVRPDAPEVAKPAAPRPDAPEAPAPKGDQWGRPPEKYVPPEAPVDRSGPRVGTSPEGGNWGRPPVRKPPVDAPDFSQPKEFTSPKSDQWGKAPEKYTPPEAPVDRAGPRVGTSSEGNWGRPAAPKGGVPEGVPPSVPEPAGPKPVDTPDFSQPKEAPSSKGDQWGRGPEKYVPPEAPADRSGPRVGTSPEGNWGRSPVAEGGGPGFLGRGSGGVAPNEPVGRGGGPSGPAEPVGGRPGGTAPSEPVGSGRGPSGPAEPVGARPGGTPPSEPVGPGRGPSGPAEPVGGRPGGTAPSEPVGPGGGPSGPAEPVGARPGGSAPSEPVGPGRGPSGPAEPVGARPGGSAPSEPVGPGRGPSGPAEPVGGRPGGTPPSEPVGPGRGPGGPAEPVGGRPGGAPPSEPVGPGRGPSGPAEPVGGRPGGTAPSEPVGSGRGPSGPAEPVGGRPGGSAPSEPVGPGRGPSGPAEPVGGRPGGAPPSEPVGPGGGRGDTPEIPTERPGTRPNGEVPTERPTPEAPTERPGTRPSGEVPTERPIPEPPTERPGTRPSGETPTERPNPEAPTERPGARPSGEVPTERPAPELPTEKPGPNPSGEPPTERVTPVEDGSEPPTPPRPDPEDLPFTPAEQAEIAELRKLSPDELDRLSREAYARGDGRRIDMLDEAMGRQTTGGAALAEPIDLNNRQAEIDRYSKYSVENLRRLERYWREQGNHANADLIQEAYQRRIGFQEPIGGPEPELERLAGMSDAELDRRLAIAKANGDDKLTKYLEAAKRIKHERATQPLESDFGGLDDMDRSSGGGRSGDRPPTEPTPQEAPPPEPQTPREPTNLSAHEADIDYYARNYSLRELEDLRAYYKWRGRTVDADIVQAAYDRARAYSGQPLPGPADPNAPEPGILPETKIRPAGVKVEDINLGDRAGEIKKYSEYNLQELHDIEAYWREKGNHQNADLIADARKAKFAGVFDKPMTPQEIERLSHSSKPDLEWDLKRAREINEHPQRIRDLEEAIRVKEAREAAKAAAENTEKSIDSDPNAIRAGNAEAEINRLTSSHSVDELRAMRDNLRAQGKAAEADIAAKALERNLRKGYEAFTADDLRDMAEVYRAQGDSQTADAMTKIANEKAAAAPAGFGDKTDPNLSKPGTSRPEGQTPGPDDPSLPGFGDKTDPDLSRPDGAGGDEVKANPTNFNSARNNMRAAEAELQAAKATGDPAQIRAAQEKFDIANERYINADTRRAYQHAVDQRNQAVAEANAAEKAATDARAAAAKADRAASADPGNAQLREQAKEARAAAERARLANLKAEENLANAGTREVEAAERLRNHIRAEAQATAKVDKGIQDAFDAPGNEKKGGMRVVGDSDALVEQQRELERLKKEWKKPNPDPLDPIQPKSDGVLGINDRDTNRSIAMNDQGVFSHERLHANTSQNWKNNLGNNFTLNEGMTNHLTIEYGGQSAVPGGPRNDLNWGPEVGSAYKQPVDIVRQLEGVVGKGTMRDAYFKGKTFDMFQEVGRAAGAPPGEQVVAGRNLLNEIDKCVRIAKDPASPDALKAAAAAHLNKVMARITSGGKP